MLDTRELDTVGIEGFFLNACQSYDQGMALIDAGAVGGVVALNDVINSGAVRVGRTMIRLLNRSFRSGRRWTSPATEASSRGSISSSAMETSTSFRRRALSRYCTISKRRAMRLS